MVGIRDWGGILGRVEDSGRGGMTDGNIESLLDLYLHKEHVLRVLSPGLIATLVRVEEGRVC
jgi:hypothetical protein